MNKRFPRYPDDADYQTNAPSYYEDLARKQKLIQLLAEKIWDYENILNETLEQIEKRLTDYILENDILMNERLENWDKRIEEMPEEMRSLFVTWLNDGTLEQIINHDVLGNKADKTYVDSEIERLDIKSEEYLKGLFVSYDLFDDGTLTDDELIRTTHEYANLHNIPVIQTKGEYFLEDSEPIIIKTNVYWGQTVFHLNSQTIDNHKFLIDSYHEPIHLTSELNLGEFSQKINNDLAIDELNDYSNHYMRVIDEHDRVGIRSTQANHNGFAREDFFLIEDDGKLVGDKMWKFNHLTDVILYYAEDSFLTVDGGVFNVSKHFNENIGSKRYQNLGFSITRSRTIIENQVIKLDNMATESNSQYGFYHYKNLYDLTFKNIRNIPRDDSAEMGSYGFAGDRVMNLTFDNVVAEGSDNTWGVIGMNYIKDLQVYQSKVNLVDVHFQAWNVTVRDSTLGKGGVKVTGGGQLTIDNVIVDGHIIVTFREDFGSVWNGDISINNVKMFPHGSADLYLLNYRYGGSGHRVNYKIADNIYISNVVVDYKLVPNNDRIARLIRFPYTSTNLAMEDRYIFPKNIVVENVRVKNRQQGLELIGLYIVEFIKGAHENDVNESDGALKTNANIIFKNIDIDETLQATTYQNPPFHLTEYTTHHVLNLVPKVIMDNVGKVFMYVKNVYADIEIRNSEFSGGDLRSGGKNYVKLTLNNVKISPDVTHVSSDGKAYLLYNNAFPMRLINCELLKPKVAGVELNDLTAIKKAFSDLFILNGNIKAVSNGTFATKGLSNKLSTLGEPLTIEFKKNLFNHIE